MVQTLEELEKAYQTGYNEGLQLRKDYADIKDEELKKAYHAGRRDILDELAHEQRKLLDGLAHPKECGECKIKQS